MKNNFESEYGFRNVKDGNTDSSSRYYIHFNKLFFRNYRIEINERRLDDSIYYEYTNVFNQVPLKNEILFYQNDSIISKNTIPFMNVKAENYKGRTLLYSDNKISSINLILKDDLYLILISGYGGCNSCNESTCYFSLDGKLIYFWYGNEDNVIKCLNSSEIKSNKDLEEVKVFKTLYFY